MTAAHPATLAYESAVERAQVACAALSKAEREAERAVQRLRSAERRFGVTLARVRRARRGLEEAGLGPRETYDSRPAMRPELGDVWMHANTPGLLDSEDETTD